MHAFSRLATFLLFVLSLSIFATALPAPGTSGALSARDSKCEALLGAVVELKGNVDTCISVIAKAEAVADAKAQLNLMVGHIESTAHAITAIGPIRDMDAVVKADIAAKIAAIVAVVLKACLKLSIKFGTQVLVDLFAKVDVVLKLLLVNIGACVDGLAVLVDQIVVTTCAHIIVDLKFHLCADALAAVGILLN
ncbi:unnamed protein product [Rhizoctonia solani]|uniref:Transmembrane protein n=1 Tax=Rhizoctonia solani TaxID=456999 RepID=A0A8H3AWM0_9AGAM|nr:unnamed protein product [Rhizoctonia solani]